MPYIEQDHYYILNQALERPIPKNDPQGFQGDPPWWTEARSRITETPNSPLRPTQLDCQLWAEHIESGFIRTRIFDDHRAGIAPLQGSPALSRGIEDIH